MQEFQGWALISWRISHGQSVFLPQEVQTSCAKCFLLHQWMHQFHCHTKRNTKLQKYMPANVAAYGIQKMMAETLFEMGQKFLVHGHNPGSHLFGSCSASETDASNQWGQLRFASSVAWLVERCGALADDRWTGLQGCTWQQQSILYSIGLEMTKCNQFGISPCWFDDNSMTWLLYMFLLVSHSCKDLWLWWVT